MTTTSVYLPGSDYSDRDFVALYERLKSTARSVWPGLDDDDANPTNLDFGSFAHIGDVIARYQDQQAREAIPTTATQRKNVANWYRCVGYIPSGTVAAIHPLTVSLSAPPTGSVSIPAETIARTLKATNPEKFRFLTAASFTPGMTPPSVILNVEHSEVETDSVESDGTPNQTFQLEAPNYIDGSAVAVFSNGTFVVSPTGRLLESTSSDCHFIEIVDDNGLAKLRFGNGVNGKIPEGTGVITYKTGGGEGGNVELHAIEVIEGSFTDSLGNPVTVAVDNATGATVLGRNRETMAQIAANGPASISATTRSVSRTDFEDNARLVPGIARALFMGAADDSGVPENSGYIYVVPEPGTVLTTSHKDAVYRMVTEQRPCLTTFRVVVLDPVYRDVDVLARVWLKTGADPLRARAAILAALDYFFIVTEPDLLPDGSDNPAKGTPNTRVDFGYNLRDEDTGEQGEVALSDVFNAVRDVTTYVRKLGYASTDFMIGGHHQDLQLANNEFPRLGTVLLYNGVTGAIL